MTDGSSTKSMKCGLAIGHRLQQERHAAHRATVVEYARERWAAGHERIRLRELTGNVLDLGHAGTIGVLQGLVEDGILTRGAKHTDGYRLVEMVGRPPRAAEAARETPEYKRREEARTRREADRARVVAHVREQAKVGLRGVRIADVARLLGCHPTYASSLMTELVADGVLERGVTNAHGFHLTPTRSSAAPVVYLDQLLARARACTHTDTVAKSGRRAVGSADNVVALTPGQLDDIERLARLICERHPRANRVDVVDGCDDAAAFIDGRYMYWTPQAIRTRDGWSPGWALHEPVQRWVEEQHRDRYERRQAAERQRKTKGLSHDEPLLTTPWSASLAAASVGKARGAVGNLLDLAATAISGEHPPLIDPSPRIRQLPSASDAALSGHRRYDDVWTRVIPRWARGLLQHAPEVGLSPRSLRLIPGLTLIAEYATREVEQHYAGGLPPYGAFGHRETDWLAVRDAMLTDARAGHLSKEKLVAASCVWRIAYSLVAHRCPRVTAWETPPGGANADTDGASAVEDHSTPRTTREGMWEKLRWPDRDDLREALVPHAAQEAAALWAEADKRDFAGWADRDGRPYTALVEGEYGLRLYSTWATIDEHRLARYTPPLPARMCGEALPDGRQRRKAREQPQRLRSNSLVTRFAKLCRLLGWSEAAPRPEHRTDWHATGFERLLTEPALTMAYVDDLLLGAARRRRRDDETGRPSAIQVVLDVAWFANGWGWARATQLAGLAANRAASATTDVDRTEALDAQVRHQRIADACRETYRVLIKHASQIEGERNGTDRDAHITAQVAAVADAWRGFDGRSGLLKLRHLRDLLVDDIVEIAGGLTLEEQLERIRAGTFVRTAAWASAVQFATLLTLAVRIPLRAETLSELRTEMLVWEREGGAAVPGDGAARFDIPKEILKVAHASFRPAWILPQQVGTSTHETAVCRPLLRLYFGAGGALDFARSEVDPTTGRSVRRKRGPVRDVRTDVLPRDADGAPVLTELPWLFPAVEVGSRARGPRDADTGQMTSHDICVLLRAAVRRHADALGVDAERLARTRGALGSHVFRRLFGSYWAGERGKLAFASALLHHKTVERTVKHYCARDVASITLEMTDVDGVRLDGLHAIEARGQARSDARQTEQHAGEGTPLDGDRATVVARERELTNEITRLSEVVGRLTEEAAAERARTTPAVASLGPEHRSDEDIRTLLRVEGIDAAGLKEILSVARMFGQLGRKAA